MKSALPYQLREFRPGDPEEIERMNLMFYHPQVMKFMGYKDNEFGQIRRGELQKPDRTMFRTTSVVTRKHEEVAYAVADEDNYLVGCIWFCLDSRHPFPVRVAKRLGVASTDRIYQVVYEKLLSEGWPEELVTKVIHIHPDELHRPRKGVIVEGLKRAILRLTRAYRKLYVHRRKLVLYAFVLPDNTASQKVLQKNGFKKEERQYRCDGLFHDLWVRII